MNFKEALNLPKDLDFEERYRTIINALGYEEVKSCIPFSFEELKRSYNRDKNFNCPRITPMEAWDRAAGFYINREKCILIGSPLTNLYYKKFKINTFSCAEGVCILKECAKKWLEEEENGKR